MTGPLISARELLAAIDDPDVRVVDCRFSLDRPAEGRRAYAAHHLPGAVYLSLDSDLSAPEGPGRHPLPPPPQFGARLGALGIGSDHQVVAYDDAGGAIAARLWWMLRALGHEAAFVLDGGIQHWVAVGGRLSDEPPSHQAAEMRVESTYAGIAAYDEVAARLGAMTLIDARSPERYRGEIEPIDPVAGHIPTAVNAPYRENLRPDGRFHEPSALERRFVELGVTSADEAVVYCGSGVTACHDILAMEAAGLGRATLYPGSWSDWSSRRS